MKLNVVQLPSEYTAVWWFSGITNRATELSHWVDTRDYCELSKHEMNVMCNNGGCDE